MAVRTVPAVPPRVPLSPTVLPLDDDGTYEQPNEIRANSNVQNGPVHSCCFKCYEYHAALLSFFHLIEPLSIYMKDG